MSNHKIIEIFVKDLFWRIRKTRATLCKKFKLSGQYLILAPHPDDEALGCGGLISYLCYQNDPPHVVILTGGGKSLRGIDSIDENNIIENRRKLALNSAKELGLPEENIHFLDFNDGCILKRPKTEMTRLKNLIDKLNPDNIFVPHNGEGWPDHIAAREIGIEIAPKGSTLWEYCVWMWYYNVWNLDWKNANVLRMNKRDFSAKLRAIDAYVKPLAPCGIPWSGILPKSFLKANRSKSELYFKLTR